MLDIRVVDCADEQLNQSGWAWQLRPRKLLLTVESSQALMVHSPDVHVVRERQGEQRQ